jgi:hypothetical protein
VPQRLQENPDTSWLEHPCHLAIGTLDIEVMDDRGAAHEVEAVRGELQVLGVHDRERGLPRDARAARRFAREVDGHRRDVDAVNDRPTARQLEGAATGPQPYSSALDPLETERASSSS